MASSASWCGIVGGGGVDGLIHSASASFTALRAAYEDKYFQGRDLADRSNSFMTRRKMQNSNINIARLRKQLNRDRKHFNELKARLSVTKPIRGQSAKLLKSVVLKKEEVKRQVMPKKRKYMSVMEYSK